MNTPDFDVVWLIVSLHPRTLFRLSEFLGPSLLNGLAQQLVRVLYLFARPSTTFPDKSSHEEIHYETRILIIRTNNPAADVTELSTWRTLSKMTDKGEAKRI
jgi:hypothetical protein